MMWIVIGGFALIAWMDLCPLIRRRKGHAVAAFFCVYAIALTLAVLMALKIEIPSAMMLLKNIINWLGVGYSP